MNARATRCWTRSAIWRWPVCRCSEPSVRVAGGHKLNHAVLTSLLADRTAWRIVEGEQAKRPRAAVGGMVGGMVAAYGPDVS